MMYDKLRKAFSKFYRRHIHVLKLREMLECASSKRYVGVMVI